MTIEITYISEEKQGDNICTLLESEGYKVTRAIINGNESAIKKPRITDLLIYEFPHQNDIAINVSDILIPKIALVNEQFSSAMAKNIGFSEADIIESPVDPNMLLKKIWCKFHQTQEQNESEDGSAHHKIEKELVDKSKLLFLTMQINAKINKLRDYINNYEEGVAINILQNIEAMQEICSRVITSMHKKQNVEFTKYFAQNMQYEDVVLLLKTEVKKIISESDIIVKSSFGQIKIHKTLFLQALCELLMLVIKYRTNKARLTINVLHSFTGDIVIKLVVAVISGFTDSEIGKVRSIFGFQDMDCVISHEKKTVTASVTIYREYMQEEDAAVKQLS